MDHSLAAHPAVSDRVRPWTKKEEEILVRRRNAGDNFFDIARDLNRTSDACIEWWEHSFKSADADSGLREGTDSNIAQDAATPAPPHDHEAELAKALKPPWPSSDTEKLVRAWEQGASWDDIYPLFPERTKFATRAKVSYLIKLGSLKPRHVKWLANFEYGVNEEVGNDQKPKRGRKQSIKAPQPTSEGQTGDVSGADQLPARRAPASDHREVVAEVNSAVSLPRSLPASSHLLPGPQNDLAAHQSSTSQSRALSNFTAAQQASIPHVPPVTASSTSM